MKSRVAAVAAGIGLIAAGGIVLDVAVAEQHQHAPQPTLAQAGTTSSTSAAQGSIPAPRRPPRPGAAKVHGRVIARSLPVSIAIPAIGVRSALLYVGRNADGTIQVPPLNDLPITNDAAWYEFSSTPGQSGPSIIEGHVDSASDGPSVFFRLGALNPGDLVDVTLADRQVAVFKITGVRLYAKDHFPTGAVYGDTDHAVLRLITCGGSFDTRDHHYLSNVVAFASLVSSHPASGR
jgi:hypothetical protein